MSRAFVRESDQDGAAELLPDRPISSQPNLVTIEGLRQIESQVRQLETTRQAARDTQDNAELARIDRDLRYWVHRKGSARVIEPPSAPEKVSFGVHVTVRYAGESSERGFRLVGEDEADPAAGLLSWTSPLAQALIGKERGDVLTFLNRELEILELRP